MPARFRSFYPGFGFAATNGRRPMEIRCDDGLHLGWRWIVDCARALELSSRNHPSSPKARTVSAYTVKWGCSRRWNL